MMTRPEAGALTAGERSTIQEFLDAYRPAFKAFHVAAIADLFSHPC
jgi:hypothetical protein